MATFATKEEITWNLRTDSKALKSVLESGNWKTQAQLVKKNERRSVYRLDGLENGLAVYIKQDHPKSLRNQIKWLWRTKEKVEYDTAVELQKRGVRTVPVLGWGKKGFDSYLITENVPSSGKLEKIWISVQYHPDQRKRFLSAVSRFVGSLYLAGVHHTDLHPGNMIINISGAEFRFNLVDFSNIWFHTCLNNLQRFNLIVWLRDILYGLKEKEQKQIFQAVCLWKEGMDVVEIHRDLIKHTVSLSHNSWLSRRKYFLGKSKKCVREESALGKWIMLRPFEHLTAETILNTYLSNRQTHENAQGGAYKTSISKQEKNQTYFVKEFLTSRFQNAKNACMNFWLLCHRLHMYEISALKVCAWCQHKDGNHYLILPGNEHPKFTEALSEFNVQKRSKVLHYLAKFLAKLHHYQFFNPHLVLDDFSLKFSDSGNSALELSLRDVSSLECTEKITNEMRFRNLENIAMGLRPLVPPTQLYRWVIIYRKKALVSKADIRRWFEKKIANLDVEAL